MKPYDRMKELVEQLNRYAALYYEEDAPVVSDAEYDMLYDELRALEESEGYSLKNSPTHRVGGAPQKKFAQSGTCCACTVWISARRRRSSPRGTTASSRPSGRSRN